METLLKEKKTWQQKGRGAEASGDAAKRKKESCEKWSEWTTLCPNERAHRTPHSMQARKQRVCSAARGGVEKVLLGGMLECFFRGRTALGSGDRAGRGNYHTTATHRYSQKKFHRRCLKEQERKSYRHRLVENHADGQSRLTRRESGLLHTFALQYQLMLLMKSCRA